jgi:dTDP-4-dehydrorhamnose reductase
MPERILVFGGSGQVARALREFCPEAVFTARPECDFEKPETVLSALARHNPTLVLNPAAYTEVDKSETERELALQLNARMPGAIAHWCRENGASLVHFSTDYVYSGTGDEFWKESDQPGPLNWYASSKLEGENVIQVVGGHHVILRTSWVYSPWGKNFVRTMARLGRERESLDIVNDQFGAPTYAPDLARAVAALIRHPDFRKRAGVYNIANSGITNWHAFASRIFDRLKNRGEALRVKTLNPISTEQYPLAAQRPRNSRLDTGRIETDFGIRLRPWTEALDECLASLT